MPARLRTTGPLLVRATTAPTDLPHLGLDPMAAPLNDVADWLRRAWARDDVRDAISTASPDLGSRLDAQALAGLGPREVRRAARSLALYVVRWQRRCTPFGYFAGITTAAAGARSSTGVPSARTVARPDAAWLRATAEHLTRRSAAVRQVVSANALAVARDGRLLLEPRLPDGAAETGRREISIQATPLVCAVLEAAREPIGQADLLDRLARATGADEPVRVRLRRLLDSLVSAGFLVSSAAPCSTSGNGFVPLLALANATDHPARGAVANAAATAAPSPTAQETNRHRLAASMLTANPQTAPTLAVDVRFENPLTISPAVVQEAERAASVLLRLSSEPFGAVRWLDYRARFRARYGPGALVPVLNLLSDSGLGYPTGFLGAPRTRPAWRQVTDRDAVVLNLLHRAALDGSGDVVLTDDDVTALTVGDPEDVVPPARCELGFAVHTTSPAALDHGNFLLRVTAAPPSSTSMAGRFAHLLDDAGHEAMATHLSAPGIAADGPVVAQLVFRPRRENADDVVRVPVLTGHVIALDEHHDGPAERLGVHDLGVTADDEQMYLIHVSTGRRVVPVIPHALELTSRTPPLARFLAEVADARSAVFGPFDLGAARTLDHTPRIRYRRTILAPARWILHTDQIAGPGAWWDRFETWRIRHGAPVRIVLADGGTHLPLDLEQPLDRHLLEHLTAGSEHVELHEQIPHGKGWLGRPAEILAPMTPVDPPDRRPPATIQVRPDRGLFEDGLLTLRIAGNPGRFDQVIAHHLPRLATEMTRVHPHRWWFMRLRDLILPKRDQYLQVTLDLGNRAAAAAATPVLTRFIDDLAAARLPAEASLHPFCPRPGIFGDGTALDAAHDVQAADALAAVEQVRLTVDDAESAQTLTAASFVAIAAGLTGDLPAGCRLILETVPHASARLSRDVVEQACTLADPAGHHSQLRAWGDDVADAWADRSSALGKYRSLQPTSTSTSSVLRALWRDHHARVLGIDTDSERTTRLTARRVAQRFLALEPR